MGNLFSLFRVSPVTLKFHIGNISKIFLPVEAPFFVLHSETTTIGVLQDCIRDNKQYTEYPHKFPHVLIINDQRLLLEEFMHIPPSGNLYTYLRKHGFKPYDDNPKEGGVTFAVCNYNDIERFQKEGKLIVNMRELERVASRERSAEASAFRGMQMRFSGRGFNPMVGLALGRAMVAEAESRSRGSQPEAESSESGWSYAPK